MIPASKFQTQIIIASAFIVGDELKLTNAFIQALQEWSSIYDGDPISLPLSQAAPLERKELPITELITQTLKRIFGFSHHSNGNVFQPILH